VRAGTSCSFCCQRRNERIQRLNYTPLQVLFPGDQGTLHSRSANRFCAQLISSLLGGKTADFLTFKPVCICRIRAVVREFAAACAQCCERNSQVSCQMQAQCCPRLWKISQILVCKCILYLRNVCWLCLHGFCLLGVLL